MEALVTYDTVYTRFPGEPYTYGAFGKLEGRSGNTENSYQFAGEQFDENLGQYYLRQRYYDAELGRFSRRDIHEGSMSNPLSLHKYVYANLNPAILVDPSGLFPRFYSDNALGDAVERVIQTAYSIDFSGDDIYLSPNFGEPPRGIGVGLNPDYQPDLGNYTRKTYNEIKPFNPGGYSGGKTQMKKYKDSLQNDGWVPEVEWKAPPFIGGPVSILGRQIIYFNDFSGLIFYTDQIEYYQKMIQLSSLPNRERTSMLRKMREGQLALTVGLDYTVALDVSLRISTVAIAQLANQVALSASLTKGLA